MVPGAAVPWLLGTGGALRARGSRGRERSGPGRAVTLAELRERLARRAGDAAAMHASAPVADVLAVVLSELEAVEGNGTSPASAAGPDRLLTAAEAAARLAVPVRYVYAHAARLPFVVRVGRKVRCSEARLARYLERARAA